MRKSSLLLPLLCWMFLIATPSTSLGVECNGVTAKGCCDGLTLKYCAEDYLFTDDCISSCGWNPFTLYYECEKSGAEASGEYPISCGCTPSCSGKACGDDGCGGNCGNCEPGSLCQSNLCVEGMGEVGSCVGLCGASSSDGTCWCDDTCKDSGDCCPDACSACQICDVCTPECTGKACGDDGCGGACGVCPEAQTCQNGVCFGTTPLGPSCAGFCDQAGGDGSCWCDDQCLPNGDCCPDACSECGVCDGNSCQPNCAGKDCGDNGCGEPCGVCSGTDTCTNGACVPEDNPCTPDCSHKECGNDGCNGSCGACAAGEVCDTESNFWTCAPVENGEGQSSCTPSCQGKVCGDDGCGGECGTCPELFLCQPNGACLSSTSEPTNPEESDLTSVGPTSLSSGSEGAPVIQIESDSGGCSHSPRPNSALPWFGLSALLASLLFQRRKNDFLNTRID